MPERRGVVIGASSGIGAAVTSGLAGEGHRIVACARRFDHIGVGELVTGRALDVRDYAAVSETLLAAAASGPLSYVVNCAGVGFYAPLGADHGQEWRDILETNVVGLMNVCSVLLEHDLGVEQLVFVGSLAAHRVSATPGNVLYSASKKAAMLVLEDFRATLRAGGSDLRVTAISPGFVGGTDFGKRYFERLPEEAEDLYAAGANLRAADVAEIILWLLSTPPHVEVSDIIVRPTMQRD
jgi:NADP-dependent 3-hydroxy acid dehydrogenase YdfG